MPATGNPSWNSDQIAVIRSYQPVRIEHELLAQVFDLAQRGLADGSASAGVQHVPADQAANQRVSDRKQHGVQDRCTNRQISGLEAVA